MIYDIDLDIAVGQTSGALKWKNSRTSWSEVVASVSETTRTAETLKQYFSYGKERQDQIKDVGGFVGGKLRGGTVFVRKTQSEIEVKSPFGVRRKGHVIHRQIVALDVDFGNTDVWLDFINLGCAGAMYSTHKHKPTDARLRLLFPLDRPVSPDEYEAIARQVASYLGIDLFDDTTYQATRLMYYPSTASDGEYLFDSVDQPIMSADETLAEMEDYSDPTTWPRSSRETKVRKLLSASTMEDPTIKEGQIGAFCRAYTMDEAIHEFLDDVYEPCPEMGADRYSYIAGESSGGLVTYDNLFAYSHHMSDPAGGRACNAYDLVRLHKFGELDEGRDWPDISKAPSSRAMARFCDGLASVTKELIAARKKGGAEAYDEAEAAAFEAGLADEWVGELERKGDTILPTINNCVLILHNDENLRDCFAFNEFEQREVAKRALPWDPKDKYEYPRPLEPHDDSNIRLYFERAYGVKGKGEIDDAMAVVLAANSYHPVRTYIRSLYWDGEERLDRLFCTLFGVPDSEYIRAITRKHFVAAIRRIMAKGKIKYDTILTLVGEQGRGKSTVVDKMGGDWFSDSVSTIKGKEALESIQGAWLIEFGELAGMRKADIEDMKHFVAKKEDRFRVAYGKRMSYFARRCVFWATTNTDQYLRDDENRRFWTVNIRGFKGMRAPEIHAYFSEATRAQLWAEAKHYHDMGETIYLPEHLDLQQREIAEEHTDKDDRRGLVLEYLGRMLPTDWHTRSAAQRRMFLDSEEVGTVERCSVSTIEVWVECFGKVAEDINFGASKDIGKILRSIKEWESGKTERVPLYGPVKLFRKTAASNHILQWHGTHYTKAGSVRKHLGEL